VLIVVLNNESFKNVAVIVTFNKLNFLKKCLDGVLKSSDLLHKIVVVNNASTDGTERYLADINRKNHQLVVINEMENLGGAAGFNRGIKEAMQLKADAVWVMDDDTIPTRETLVALIAARQNVQAEFNSWGVLASNVRWTDGSAALMNVPQSGKPWNQSKNSNLITIDSSSFVSMYINAIAVKRLGLPISDFFIWGDDVEFSHRISTQYPSFCVTDSHVLHKMAQNQKVDILTDDKKRVPRYFYDVRNKMYMAKKQGFRARMRYGIHFCAVIVRVLFTSQYKMLKVFTMFKGLFAGIVFNPKIEKLN